MSSTTRLLVLGIVKIFQPVHGYDVRRELITWHAEEWANVAPGSIYSALKTLVKDGCLEVVGTEQSGSRPERTTFKLTARGDSEFAELLRDQLWTVRMPTDPLIAAISLMGFLDRKELVAALEARSATIVGQMKHAEYVIAAIDDVETPDHVREMMRLINARVGAELEWSKHLCAALARGEYRTLGSPPWAPKPFVAAEPTPTILHPDRATPNAEAARSPSSPKSARSSSSPKSARSSSSPKSARSPASAESARSPASSESARSPASAKAPASAKTATVKPEAVAPKTSKSKGVSR